jgi:hypothetical protein
LLSNDQSQVVYPETAWSFNLQVNDENLSNGEEVAKKVYSSLPLFRSRDPSLLVSAYPINAIRMNIHIASDIEAYRRSSRGSAEAIMIESFGVRK